MRFRLHDRGVDDVVKSAGVRAHLERTAGDVVSQVESQGERIARTRHFARSIEKTGVERTRKGVRITVFSSDFAAHIVEFGSANNPPFAPFRRAASSLGLPLRGGGERR